MQIHIMTTRSDKEGSSLDYLQSSFEYSPSPPELNGKTPITWGPDEGQFKSHLFVNAYHAAMDLYEADAPRPKLVETLESIAEFIVSPTFAKFRHQINEMDKRDDDQLGELHRKMRSAPLSVDTMFARLILKSAASVNLELSREQAHDMIVFTTNTFIEQTK
jgi:hypothetical protein